MKSELMREQVVLVTGDRPSIDDGRAKGLLEFFGIPYETREATDFPLLESGQEQSNTKCRLVCAADIFARLMEELQNTSGGRQEFSQVVHSVFLYPTNNPAGLAQVVSDLS
jgi:hypothetical protein